MPWQRLRLIDPAALDVDPLTTQPGPAAFDTTDIVGGEARCVVWEVDQGGRRVAPTATSIDVGIVMLSRVSVPASGVEDQAFWSRGAINTGVTLGEEQIQTQARSAVEFSAIVTAAPGMNPANRLAVYVEVAP